MTRSLKVYPKAVLTGNQWTFVVNVWDDSSRSKFVHTETACVFAETPLTLLKLAFDLTVGDTDTNQDVDDALYLDDIKPGPQTETVWGNWKTIAETKIADLPCDYTVRDFWAEWSRPNTAAVRSDARRTLITQRGWTVSEVHQHEGDGSVTEEG